MTWWLPLLFSVLLSLPVVLHFTLQDASLFSLSPLVLGTLAVLSLVFGLLMVYTAIWAGPDPGASLGSAAGSDPAP